MARSITTVAIFWIGYVGLTFAVGFVTTKTFASEVAQLTAWGFISSAALLALSRLVSELDREPDASPPPAPRTSLPGGFTFGLLLGAASFGVHLAVVATFAGPLRFEWVPQVGAGVVAIHFARFVATSCMEEVGFRGYPLRRLAARLGAWPAVGLTALAFGASHFLYGWDARTIALGVVPGGLLWGMSALATRGLAVPIGLHAAWNFASWSAGNRAEPGPLRMIVEDSALESTRAVGTLSYLATFGALTIAFWIVHRRSERAEALPRNSTSEANV